MNSFKAALGALLTLGFCFLVLGLAHAQTAGPFQFGQQLSSATLNNTLASKLDWNSGAPTLGVPASVDLTHATNVPVNQAIGVLPAPNGGAGTVIGALKANGAGSVSQAACADLSNAAASCATDATKAANISFGVRVTSQVSNPTGTTNATGVMMGASSGVSVTPSQTGRLLILFSGDGAVSVAGSTFAAGVRYGTGTAPANGAALSGTECTYVSGTSATANAQVSFELSCVVAGLTVGTAYWIQPRLASISGGTANIYDLHFTVIEE